MRLTIRAILLLIAVVLFLVGVVLEENSVRLLLLGLAFFAAAFVVDELGIDTGTTRRPGVGPGV